MTPILLTALLFLFLFITGFWLSRYHAPYNTTILTAHKLIALGALVYLGFTINQADRLAPPGAWVWAAAAAVGVFFLAAIATGGLLSARAGGPPLARRIHQAAPWLAALSAGAALYLMAG